jgi:hypothetical protein
MSQDEHSSGGDDADEEVKRWVVNVVTVLSRRDECRSMNKDDFLGYLTDWFTDQDNVDLPEGVVLVEAVNSVLGHSSPPTVPMEVDPEELKSLASEGYNCIRIPAESSPEFCESQRSRLVLIDLRGETESGPGDNITPTEALAYRLLGPASCLVYIVPGEIPVQEWINRRGSTHPFILSVRFSSMDASICVFGPQEASLPSPFDYWRAECRNELDLFVIIVHTFGRDNYPVGEKLVYMGGDRRSRSACMQACILLSTPVSVFLSAGMTLNERQVVDCYLAIQGSSKSNPDCSFPDEWWY